MAAYIDYSSEEEDWGEEEVDSTPISILLSLVQQYDWTRVIERILAFPDECKAVGVQGRTPLHVACDHDAPAEVVGKLLQAYPEASLMVGTTNMNPLHITCSSSHASVDVVRVLLEGGHQLQTSMRDVDGDTPLHAACRCGAPIDVLRVLLEANPTAVNERDFEGLTPLLRLWVRYFVILGDDVIEAVKGPADLTGELGEAWDKTKLLLQYATAGSPAGTAPSAFRALHAASAVDCPRAVVKIATIVHPEHLEFKNLFGDTPLLIAAKSEIFRVRDLSDDGYLLEDRVHGDADRTNNGDSSMDVSQDSTQEPSVIDILLEAKQSSASIPDCRGRLPLHLAIDSGKRWTDGVKSILDAYPEGLTVPDNETRLLPFLQAASIDKPDTGTIFELLRTDPSLLKPMVQPFEYPKDPTDDLTKGFERKKNIDRFRIIMSPTQQRKEKGWTMARAV